MQLELYAMFSFFSRPKTPPPNITSRIVFDEAYCHSAGPASGAQTYEIREGTTEIVFVFEKFDEFISTYLFNNPYLPVDIKQSVRERKAGFYAQIVQGAPYLCTESVNSDGLISFRSQSLKPLRGRKSLAQFSNGAIAFGIFRPDAPQAFGVLWATMYSAARKPPAF
jgi:hypothetical protein